MKPFLAGVSRRVALRRLAVAAGFGAGGALRPTWAQQVASAELSFSRRMKGRIPDTAYAFGADAAVPWAHNGIAVRDLSALAAHFNPLQDFTGATTINSELQVYRPAFNALDHRMGREQLGLWANLHGDQWTVRSGSQADSRLGWPLNGEPISWDRIPSTLLPHADEWREGQLVALQHKGIYRLTDLRPGESLRLEPLLDSPATDNFLYNLIAFLPIDTAVGAEPVERGSAVLAFAPGALSPTIQRGHRVALVTPDSVVRNAADVWVTDIDHARGAVRLNRGLPFGTLGAEQRFVFLPRITSGQAWTRQQWDITPASAFLAVEFDIALFEGLQESFEPAGISNAGMLARTDAAHPDAPFGAWPALWAYSADDGDRAKRKGRSEMDFMEVWVSPNSGTRLFSTGNVGGQAVWVRGGDGYKTSGNGKNKVPYSMAGAHRVAVIYQDGKTYHYLDDVLVRVEQFRWASEAPIQIGMNMAMGSLARGMAANLTVPMRPENFQRAHMDVKSLRVWHSER